MPEAYPPPPAVEGAPPQTDDQQGPASALSGGTDEDTRPGPPGKARHPKSTRWMIRHAQATEGGEYTPGTRTWIWSDLHLHHRNIIRYSASPHSSAYPLLGRRQQPGLVELPGPHLAQHPVRKRLLRDLELRRRHHTPRGCSPIRDLRAVPFDRANEQPHPHRGRDRLENGFEAAREESRFAWRRASALPARFAGAPSARGRLCVSCRHGSPSSTNDRSSGVPGSHRISRCASRRRRYPAPPASWDRGRVGGDDGAPHGHDLGPTSRPSSSR